MFAIPIIAIYYFLFYNDVYSCLVMIHAIVIYFQTQNKTKLELIKNHHGY